MASSRPWRSRLARLAEVDRAERRAVLTALGLLPPVTLVLHARGLKRARAVAAGVASAIAPLDRRVPAARVAALVEAAASALSDLRLPGVSCLARSLTLCALLERRGELPSLRIGAPKHATGEAFEAHAWVELNGVVLNDAVDVRERYALLTHA